jgi:hypothetical protein
MEAGTELGSFLGVHLGKGHIRVGIRGLFENRTERTARAALGCPEVH